MQSGGKHLSILHFKFTNILVFSLLVIFFILWSLLAQNNKLTPKYLTSFSGYYDSKNQLEVVTVGSSHAVCIDFDRLDLGTGRHFFVNGSGINSAITSVKVLQKELPNLRRVLWPISRGTLERDIRKLESTKNSTRQLVSNLPFSIDVLINYTVPSFDFYFTGQFIRLRSVRWEVDQYVKELLGLKVLKKRFSQDSSEQKYTYTDGLRDGVFINTPDLNNLKRHALLAADNLHNDADKVADYKSAAVQNFEMLKEFLEAFSKTGVEIIFIEAPLTPYYREHLSHYKSLGELEDFIIDFPTISFIRRSTWLDSTLKNGNLYFNDSNHLNKAGAQYFSQHVREQLLNKEKKSSKKMEKH